MRQDLRNSEKLNSTDVDMLNNLFRYASLLFAAAMLLSCSGASDNGGSVESKQLVITADRQFVQTFGDDYVTLTVTLGDEVVTEGVTFYDKKNNVIDVENFKFKTQTPGEYDIRAGYLTYFTKEPVTVTALAVEIPEAPADTAPASTDFETKVLLVQHTTTGCSACPSMKKTLKNVMETYSDKVVKVDCHNGTVNKPNPDGTPSNVPQDDPAFVYIPNYGSTSFPYVKFDYYTGGGNNLSEDAIKATIDARLEYKKGRSAGIAVSSELKDGQIVAKVIVKAAVEGEYNVGMMLLEDNIVSNSNQLQLGSGVEEWMHTHNSCIRYLDAGRKYNGHSLGTIEAGATSDYVFVLNLQDIWNNGIIMADAAKCTWSPSWVEDELHLGVFVTTVGKDHMLYVSNVIDCPVDGVTPFKYNE